MWKAEYGQFGEYGHIFSSVYVKNGSNQNTNLPGSAASLEGNNVVLLRFTVPHDDIFACCSSTKNFFRFSFDFKRLSVIFSLLAVTASSKFRGRGWNEHFLIPELWRHVALANHWARRLLI